MKILINNIELISFSYMNLNNNALDKFGIEYSYIVLAINNMLGFTNNIKDITIDKTNTTDLDWMQIFAIGLVGGGI